MSTPTPELSPEDKPTTATHAEQPPAEEPPVDGTTADAT